MEKDKERKKMIEHQLIQRCVSALTLGAIPEFQISDWLTQNGVAKFDLDRLTNEVKEAYEKERTC